MVIFILLGIVAIAAAGFTMAIVAKKPTRLAAWASAYLALVAGLAQLGLAAGYDKLRTTGSTPPAVIAFIIFNIGNVLVLAGTRRRYKTGRAGLLVNLGGASLALAMVLLIIDVLPARFSWTLTGFLCLVVILLVSMPIGLRMSARRQAKAAAPQKTS